MRTLLLLLLLRAGSACFGKRIKKKKQLASHPHLSKPLPQVQSSGHKQQCIDSSELDGLKSQMHKVEKELFSKNMSIQHLIAQLERILAGASSLDESGTKNAEQLRTAELAEQERTSLNQQKAESSYHPIMQLQSALLQLESTLKQKEAALETFELNKNKTTRQIDVQKNLDDELDRMQKELNDEWLEKYMNLQRSTEESLQKSYEANDLMQQKVQAMQTKFQSFRQNHTKQIAQLDYKLVSHKETIQKLLKEVATGNDQVDTLKLQLATMKQETEFCTQAFHQRSYVNMTHLGEFAHVLGITARGTLLAMARPLTCKIPESVAKRYERFSIEAGVMYDEHLGPLVNMTIDHTGTIFSVVHAKFSESFKNGCESVVSYMDDDEDRSQAEKMCLRSDEFVSTLFALPFFLILGHLAVFAILIPLRIAWYFSPIRLYLSEGCDSAEVGATNAAESQKLLIKHEVS
jgi:hypothetical protein